MDFDHSSCLYGYDSDDPDVSGKKLELGREWL
jgi:hypothetical protein